MKNRFHFKSIRKKMMFGYSLIIFLVLGLAISRYLSIKNTNDNTRTVVNEELPILIANEKVALNTAQRSSLARGYLLTGESYYKDEFLKYTEEAKQYQDEALKLKDSEELQALFDKTVEKGTHQIETTGETFSQISTAVTDMVNNIKMITESFSDMAANSQEINRSKEDIAASSEESAAGIEEASAASQQASSTMEEVSGSSEHLAALAEQLNGLIQRFKL